MASWRQAHCNYDGAFKAGMNDARAGNEMRMTFAEPCPAQVRAEAERGYRDGYSRGVGGGPVVVSGQGGGAVVAGTTGGPGYRCVEAYGKKACGYHCIEAYGEVRCASQPHHNCVEAYGKIACGQNCREAYGEIVCD
jgi:hypothetical protein